MKEDKTESPFSDAADRLEEVIADNQKLFDENLRKLQEIFTEKPPVSESRGIKGCLIGKLQKILQDLYGSAAVRQEQMHAQYINMLQDLSRLEVFLAEKAYLKGQMELVRIQTELIKSQRELASQAEQLRSQTELARSQTEWIRNHFVSRKTLLSMLGSPLYCADRKEPCIIQTVSVMNFGDAVGNDVLAIKHAIEEEGGVTAVYTGNVHPDMQENGIFHMSYLPAVKEEDIVICHFASEDPFVEKVKQLKCRLVLRYHNVTPPEYFHRFDKQSEDTAKKALEQVRDLAGAVDFSMADSQFNRQNLLAMGYQCPVETIPILIPFADYEQKPDQKVIGQYRDGRTNLIFVGRGAPNKKIEDVIRCFMAYKRNYDAQARLFLVGRYEKQGAYYAYLQQVMKEEGAFDIIFPGHISFAEILAYYKIADIFLCMSEHEGFCVPLAEAMFFKVPVIAYHSSAVPQTLGTAGILLKDKHPDAVALEIHRVMTDPKTAEELAARGQEQIGKFRYETVKAQLMGFLESIKSARER